MRAAVQAVATYMNNNEENYEVRRGDVRSNLIYVVQMTPSPALDSHAYVYSLNTKRVYTVSGDTDPILALATIADRDAA